MTPLLPDQQAEREHFVNLLRSDLGCAEGEAVRPAIRRLKAELTSKEQQLTQAESAIASLKQEKERLQQEAIRRMQCATCGKAFMEGAEIEVVSDEMRLHYVCANNCGASPKQRIRELTEALREWQAFFDTTTKYYNARVSPLLDKTAKLLTSELSKAEATVQSEGSTKEPAK